MNQIDYYITKKELLNIIHIHKNTLYNLVKQNKIDYVKIGNKFLYNITKFLKINNNNGDNKKNICYCRVSSNKQKKDLVRQIKYMKNKYPDCEIISDIGSGLNFKRKGLCKIIDYAIKGEINELIIAYKDRLARIGYDLIKYIIERYSNGKIIILNSINDTVTEELTKDIISIMNIYVAKINGMRKYTNKFKKRIIVKSIIVTIIYNKITS